MRVTHSIIGLTLLAFTLWFYVWTAGHGRGLVFDASSHDYYNDLTDGIVAGHLSLQTQPLPELLALDDPYDPAKSEPYRLHDASLYKGRYYLYFGITPVALLFLPLRFLGLGRIPESAAVVCFVFGALVWSLLTLDAVRRRLHPTPNILALFFSLILIGFGGSIPFLLRRPGMYEVAIGGGFFCIAAATCFFVTAALAESMGAWRLALGSLFLGLAVGCRPNLILAFPLMLLPLWRLRKDRDARRSVRVGQAAALIVPLAACLFILGFYNYLRFDSWTEFGNGYQLAGVDVRKPKLDTRRIPTFSYLYTLHPPDVDFTFLYVHPQSRMRAADPRTGIFNGKLTGIGSILSGWLPPETRVEPIAGVVATTPVLWILLFVPLLVRRGIVRRRHGPVSKSEEAVSVCIVVLTALGILQLLFLCTFPGATMRYIVDFGPLLMTAAGMLMLLGDAELRRRPAVRALGWAVAGILLGVTVFLNVGLSISGYDLALFRRANPSGYDSLQRATGRYARYLARFVGGRVPGVTASGYYRRADEYRPENAFDGNDQTAWVAENFEQATLVVTPQQPGLLTSIRLRAPQEPNIGRWQRVEVRPMLRSQELPRQILSMPGRAPVEEVSVTPVYTDAMVLVFSDPVTTPAGNARIDPKAIPPGYAEITPGWAAPRVTASSVYASVNEFKVDSAFDGDENTVWVAQGSGPARIEFHPPQPGVLERISLLARHTSLMEAWQKLDVQMFLDGALVSEKSFTFETAASRVLQIAEIGSIKVDRVDLRFSDPVTTRPGGDHVDPRSVNPGYAEILFVWKD